MDGEGGRHDMMMITKRSSSAIVGVQGQGDPGKFWDFGISEPKNFGKPGNSKFKMTRTGKTGFLVKTGRGYNSHNPSLDDRYFSQAAGHSNT